MDLDKNLKDEIVRTILQYVQPKRIILFGSRARGDANEKFDIDIAVEAGDSVSSLKEILKEAFAAGFIQDEYIWLNILNDRNLSVHIYDEKTSRSIFKRIKEQYLREFEDLINKLKNIDS